MHDGAHGGLHQFRLDTIVCVAMEADKLFFEMRESLNGHTVRYTRLAADSLILYVECEPGDKQGWTLWLDPPWHISAPHRLLLGSRQTQGETDETWPTKEELNRISGKFHDLRGHPIYSLEVDPRSRDLIITLSQEHQVRTLATAPNRDLWHVRDNGRDLNVVGCAARFYVRE
jgi:hypothetical protein